MYLLKEVWLTVGSLKVCSWTANLFLNSVELKPMYVLVFESGNLTVAWYIISEFRHFLSRGHSLSLVQLHDLFSGSGGLRTFVFLAAMIFSMLGVHE